MKKRLDQLLVDKGLAPSKTKAKEMIELGQVQLKNNSSPDWATAKKPSQNVQPDEIEIQFSNENLLKYVSRSGFKLEGVLEDLNLDVNGKTSLDIGQSTGGFTDCLIQRGSSQVTGIDIGADELDDRLVKNQKVSSFFKVNARHLDTFEPLRQMNFDMVVIDLSFISLELVLPVVTNFIKSGGHLLALVKPQFEVGTANISKGGIVKDETVLSKLREKMLHLATQLGLVDSKYIAARIKGRDGNQEYFLYGKKK